MIDMKMPETDLFDSLLSAGDRMITALEDSDLDAFTSALDERHRIIEALKKTKSPSDVRREWESVATAIAHQDDRIFRLAAAVQESISTQIAQTAKMGQASRSYGQSQPKTQLLHGSLSG